MSRIDARQVKPKLQKFDLNFVTIYNPIIKNLQTVSNNLLILSGDPKNKNIYFQKVPSMLHIKKEIAVS